MSTPAEEKKIWDIKATLDVGYEMWNEHDQTKFVKDTEEAISNLKIKGKKILEIGCGIGRLAIPIAIKNPDKRIIGIDISPSMIEIAHERSDHLKNISFYDLDGRSLKGIGSNKFDMVYSMVVFQHIPNEAKIGYIKEAHRVLKKDGIIRFQYVEGDNEGLLSHHCRMNDVIEWCEKAGFDVQAVDEQLMHKEWTWITARKR